MKGFGLAPIRTEGAPAHPLDVFQHCGCDDCERRVIEQARAYFAYRRAHGADEALLAQEPYYREACG